MNINNLLELLRNSLLNVTAIKDAVNGNIYPNYINQSSKLPCITNHFLGGITVLRDGGIKAIVQCRIWTDSANYTKFLYDIHADIYEYFKQNDFHDDNLDLITYMGIRLPTIMPEMLNGNMIYSLPLRVDCKAIFN